MEGFPGGCGSAGPDSPLMDLTEPLDLAKGLEERGAWYFMASAGCTGFTEGLTECGKKPFVLCVSAHVFCKCI